jgi:glycine hydroxymethyltransferase
MIYVTISKLIKKEQQRQQETLMLIPSENYTYPEVRQAVGSVLMHKYAEGKPGKRLYQGNVVADEVESWCQQAALKAFSLSAKEWGVNVQPHSGSPANLAVYLALIEPGEKIMAMYLPEGGHLSHGWQTAQKKVTLVSKVWQVDFYRVDPQTRVLNYDQVEKQARKFKPKLIVSGGTAYPREIDYRQMAKIAHQVGAWYLADIAHEAGLVAGGVNISPFPDADIVTMTTHKTLRGPRGAMIFSRKELSHKIDAAVFPGLQGGPHLNTIAGMAVALMKTKTKEFGSYAGQTVKNAQFLADKLAGYGFDVVSGGTDKHLVLIDLRNKKVNGWFVALALEAAGIVVNRNTVPGEDASAYYPSGLRLGTPAVTVRGMKEKEMDQVASWINQVVERVGERMVPRDKRERSRRLKAFKAEIEQDAELKRLNDKVKRLCRGFPI